MCAATAVSVVHALPGRVRLHVPGWRAGEDALEQRFRRERGVRRVAANALTGNVLVVFDPQTTSATQLAHTATTIASAAGEDDTAAATTIERRPPPPSVLVEDGVASSPTEPRSARRRARITVRGLDRDAMLAARVIEKLERFPGVTARASMLTGRVLVESRTGELPLDELIEEVKQLEAPASAHDEPRPTHPLDPALITLTGIRLASGLSGFGAVVVSRARGRAHESLGALRAAAVMAIVESAPPVRDALERALGRDRATLAFWLPRVVALVAGGSAFSLGIAALDAAQRVGMWRAIREGWRRHESRTARQQSLHAGAVMHLEAGDVVPLPAVVEEGTGIAIAGDGFPVPVAPATVLEAGSRLGGGPFTVRLESTQPFELAPRPAPLPPTPVGRYVRRLEPVALAYLGLSLTTERSVDRALAALMLVNGRPATLAADAAEAAAVRRLVRANVTVVGTRGARRLRRPTALLVDGARVLTNGLEVVGAIPLRDDEDEATLLARAARVSVAAGAPWGAVFRPVHGATATDGAFDGTTASAVVDGERLTLAPVHPDAESRLPTRLRLEHRADALLVIRDARGQALGIIVLRPRIAPGLEGLVERCRAAGVELAIVDDHAHHPRPAVDPRRTARVHMIAQRARVPVSDEHSLLAAIDVRQREGGVVAVLSDAAPAAAFAAGDLAISLTPPSAEPGARADLIVGNLTGATDVVDALDRLERLMVEGVQLSVLGNAAGALWGLLRRPPLPGISRVTNATALAAFALIWTRMRGGARPTASVTIADPQPERWGRKDVASVLTAFDTSETGLTSEVVAERWHGSVAPRVRGSAFGRALVEQVSSPLIIALLTGGVLSLMMGALANAAIVGFTIAVNVVVSAWQERSAGAIAEALERRGATGARVMRDGVPRLVAADDLVPGDLLLLAPGDRIAADARLLDADGLEVDESALTGESLPVRKHVRGGSAGQHVVLAGTDVTVGRGAAVVVAVSANTRMGATAAAASDDYATGNPLTDRLGQILRQVTPATIAGGVIVAGAGVLWGRPWLPQLAMGASVSLAAFPEGIPLLAAVGQAAVARRLSLRHALVRRVSAVEALGRVDVACVDKTGTMTQGKLAVALVADLRHEYVMPAALTKPLEAPLGGALAEVLLTAALASPHPEAPDAAAHPTDVAVAAGAAAAGLDGMAARERQSRFDPAQGYHAAVVNGRLRVKGAPEALVARCARVRDGGEWRTLDGAGRAELLARVQSLATRGLRVLLVAEGDAATIGAPNELAALGFIGLSDPLRSDVAAAVRRCHDAGIRVIMLTGDHPETARTIAREAGLLNSGEVLSATELAELENGELDERIDRVSVIARATPLDKLRIIGGLQRRGHIVAMTGDGVNDAPALRLADVGVAMGLHGTEVARQTADVVLADDNFSTLVDALVEGRNFWLNIRRSLGLLLGGNLGELALVAGATVLGRASPLTVRQILATNLITDALPALAIATQRPTDGRLSALRREGDVSLGRPLRREMTRRAVATAAPSVAAYLTALGTGSLPHARTVAFGSIVATQLAQTLRLRGGNGLAEIPDPAVIGAVAASAGATFTLLLVPPARTFFELAQPSPLGWALIAGSVVFAPMINAGLMVWQERGTQTDESTARSGWQLSPVTAG